MKKIFLSVMALSLLTSCASHVRKEREVEAKVAQTKVSDSQGLGGTIQELISNSKHLSESQKKEITDLLTANKKRADELQEQSFKYRAVLLEELLSGEKVDMTKVRIIKKDIKRIEDLRLKNTFDTVEKISRMVSGHPENQQYLRHLINIERPMVNKN
jgi:uncharacterized protein YcfL